MSAKFTENLNIKISPEQLAAVQAFAADEERTMSDVARRLLRYALADFDPKQKA